MSITPKREEQVAFSQPLFNTPSRLIAKDGSGLQPTVLSLRGKAVGVAQGSTQEAYAKAHWATAGINAGVVCESGTGLSGPALRSKHSMPTFTDALAGINGFLHTPQGSVGYGFAGRKLSAIRKHLEKVQEIGFRKDDPALRQKVDQAIDSMLKDGTYKRIEKKYFDIDIHGS